MYDWRAKAQMVPCACIGWSESAHSAHVQRHFFTWRGPYMKDDLSIYILSSQFYHMSQRITKPTKWYVRLAKTQISLGIRPVWSVLAIRMKKAWVLIYPLITQQRLWSDWENARLIGVFAGQAYNFVGFVMPWLIFILNILTFKLLTIYVP